VTPVAELLAPPAIDALLVAYLQETIPPEFGVRVSTRIPNPRPDALVRVMLTGGAGRSSVVLHTSTVAVEAWGPDVPSASSLANYVDALLFAAPGDIPDLYGVRSVGAVQYYPDADTGAERYTASYELVTRVRPATAPTLDPSP